MIYPDSIRVTRQTNTGSLDDFGQPNIGSTLILSDSADIQDADHKLNVELSGDEDYHQFARVFLREAQNVFQIQIEDDIYASYGTPSGTTRTGVVEAIEPFNRALQVRWHQTTTS